MSCLAVAIGYSFLFCFASACLWDAVTMVTRHLANGVLTGWVFRLLRLANALVSILLALLRYFCD